MPVLSKSTKRTLSSVEKASAEEFVALRLDEPSKLKLDSLLAQLKTSSDELHLSKRGNVDDLTDEQYETFSVKEKEQSQDAKAIVHFLAPRILRMKEGEGKRRWKSILAKFKRDEQIA